MAGEYGEATPENGYIARPHYHALIFGHEFTDKKLHQKNAQGDNLYTSEKLENQWQNGYCTTGELTFESAAYVARYVLKKITGDTKQKHYESLNYATGEITDRTPEYNKMSRRPGIAQSWLKKYQNEVYPSDTIVHKGRVMRPPAYYDKIFALDNSIELESLKEQRRTHMRKHEHDIIPSRLKQRETVKLAQLRQLKRGINNG